MRDVIRRAFVLLFVASPLLLAAACRPQSTPSTGGTPAAAPEAYVPGLGEMMSLQQMRHAKLWFAGQAENWELAAYEIDELGEGFDDIVKFHPTHKDSPVAPRDAIPRMAAEPDEIFAHQSSCLKKKRGGNQPPRFLVLGLTGLTKN